MLTVSRSPVRGEGDPVSEPRAVQLSDIEDAAYNSNSPTPRNMGDHDVDLLAVGIQHLAVSTDSDEVKH